VHIEQEGSFRHAIISGGINLFTGAGFSLLAKDQDGRPLPTGLQLRNELAERFEVAGGTDLDLPQLATVIEARDRVRLQALVRRRFTVGAYDSRYRVLDHLNIKSILTVNVDDLIHNVYSGSTLHYVNDLDRRGASFGDRTAIDYVALHGSVRDDSRPFTFGSQELAAVFANDPDRWHILSARLQESASLFWGYSLSDAGILQTLHPSTRGMRSLKPMWITLLESSADDGTVAFFKAMGFNLIIADTEEMLDYLDSVSAAASTDQAPIGSASELAPEYAIPDPDTLPVRPLDVFFDGAPPAWTDAASQRVPRLSHYRTLVDSIHQRKNVVLIGLPGCGKSTLLMQAALETEVEGYKLFTGALSVEKAEMLVSRLDGRLCTIFIENFTDSVQAFDRLTAEHNIQVVGADRDYNFDIVSHIVDMKNLDVLQVSELTPEDVQSVYSSIPIHQRLQKYVRPQTSQSRSPSVFEVVQGNLVGPGLVDRYISTLKQLQKVNPSLADLLLVTCYMQQARTFASMDLLLAFFREVIPASDFTELYAMIETLGRMLSFAERWTPDDLQDYFTPRSQLLAEIVLEKAARPEELRGMLRRFWSEVSPYRIPNYYSFRRNAFDWRLFRRAFPDPDEGRAFYEYLIEKDSTPYLRQHGALYLADHKRYREAFEWIDEALAEPTIQNKAGAWTIRNSHAIILFKANIDAPEDTDGTVESTLRRSMAILEDCYRKDRRKAYHATVFAQQAIKYNERYRDEQGAEYLTTETPRV